MTTDLVTWLRQQLDELEESAGGADGAYIYFDAIDDEARDFYLERDPPKLALAEVDAKRRVLDLHEGDHECSTIRRGTTCDGEPYEEIDNCTWVLDGDCSTVRLLALPYADREGYDESWRP